MRNTGLDIVTTHTHTPFVQPLPDPKHIRTLTASLAPRRPAQCPIFVATELVPYGGLPANPFLALITADGKCLCPSPQTCSE